MAKIQFSSWTKVFIDSGTYNKNWASVLPTTDSVEGKWVPESAIQVFIGTGDINVYLIGSVSLENPT